MYQIKKYTFQQAKKLGVRVRPSTQKHKKIDVFNNDGRKVASVGYKGMMDFPTYVQKKGRSYANKRRKLYYIRHSNDGHTKGSNGWYAKHLLW
jgi:hypothetical protein